MPAQNFEGKRIEPGSLDNEHTPRLQHPPELSDIFHRGRAMLNDMEHYHGIKVPRRQKRGFGEAESRALGR